jgi:DNA-binding FrmR family transcriptional regulator
MAEKSLENRINNIIGQLKALKGAVNGNKKDCVKTIIQLKAAKAATASLLNCYLQKNLKICSDYSDKRNKELLKKIVIEISK